MKEKLKHYAIIYSVPLIIFMIYTILQTSFLQSTWLLVFIGFAFLFYCDYYSCEYTKEELNNSIVIRRYYFTYLYFFAIYAYPYVKGICASNSCNNVFGLSNIFIIYLGLLVLGVFAYIFIISDSHISEISMGSAKVTILKEKFEKDLDDHIDLTNSLIDKIKAEHNVIQNLSYYCQEARRHNGVIVDEFQNILEIYYDQQTEKSQVFIVENINTSIKNDFNLKDLEYKDLQRHMNRNELYAIKTDKHYMFLPYIEESFEELLGEPLRIYIIVESEQPIIEQERYIILNILKEFYEKLLVNIHIE